jgi:steroid 5-alpha reductase family enzyme
VIGATLAFVVVLMLVTWLLSVVLRDVSIVDLVWGLGFVGIAWVAYLATSPENARALLIVLLTTVWGVRLSAYLIRRNVGKGEDYRYVAMRERHGARFAWVSLLTVFGLQGLLMWIIAGPLQFGMDGARALGAVDAVGLAVWAVGLVYEAGADLQLSRFRSDPANRGRVLDRGLWRNTRHPNYFGDFLVWWGLYLIAAAGGAWWTIYGPIMMSFLLMRVSGVRLLERTIGDRRPEYAVYVRTTNAFFPGPRRRVE